MSTDTSKIVELYENLRKIAPKLTIDPWFIPAQDLMRLIAEHVKLSSISKAKKAAKACSLCQSKCESSTCDMYASYRVSEEFDKLEILTVIIACEKCISVLDLSSLMGLSASACAMPENEELNHKLALAAAHFLKVNGLDLSDRVSFHNAFALASGLMINRPNMKISLSNDFKLGF